MMDEKQIRERAGNIRLFAMDLDGTGINSKKEFTMRTRRAVQKLIDRGYLVVPTTGRSFYGLLDGLLKLEGVEYVISADGAFVTNCITGERIWEQLIPCSVAAALGEELLEEGNCVYFHRNDLVCTHIMACTSRELYDRVFRRPDWPKPEEIVTNRFDEFILKESRDVVKLGLFFTRPDGFETYERLIAGKYPQVNYFRTDRNVMEITSCRTSKGEALRALADRLGLSGEQICAIGDNGNDVSMLEYAGLGVAMGNAISQVREIADYIAKTNDEDGVACFIEEFF